MFQFRFDVPHDCSVELSPKGYRFFTDIFETFDKAILLASWLSNILLMTCCRTKMVR